MPSPVNSPAPTPESGPSLGAETTTFLERFTAKINKGVPVVDAIDSAAEGCKIGALQEALVGLSRNVGSGMSLAEAMKVMPLVFSTPEVLIVSAGEIGGVLDIALQRLVEYRNWTPAAPLPDSIAVATPEIKGFYFRMGTLVTMGVPILEAIQAAALNSGELIARAAMDIISEIRGGGTFVAPMRLYPQLFSPVAIERLNAGEEIGDLDTVLLELAN